MNKNQSNRRKELKVWFWDYKSQLKCSICGEDHPACIEFHHTDPSKKDSTISYLVKRGCKITTIKKELKKCAVVCSNCHKKIHWKDYSNSLNIPVFVNIINEEAKISKKIVKG